MWMLLIGLVLLALKLTAYGPVGQWSWWAVLAPFGLAVLWWSWADSSGWTKRQAMDKFDLKRQKRRERNLEALGMGSKKPRDR